MRPLVLHRLGVVVVFIVETVLTHPTIYSR